MKIDGKKVRVYRNLHKKCFSVKCMVTNKVIAHVGSISLESVTFPVMKSGRARVLRDKQKNVHAFVQGIVSDSLMVPFICSRKICYDPYKKGFFFYCSNGREIKRAKAISIGSGGVYVSPVP